MLDRIFDHNCDRMSHERFSFSQDFWWHRHGHDDNLCLQAQGLHHLQYLFTVYRQTKQNKNSDRMFINFIL